MASSVHQQDPLRYVYTMEHAWGGGDSEEGHHGGGHYDDPQQRGGVGWFGKKKTEEEKAQEAQEKQDREASEDAGKDKSKMRSLTTGIGNMFGKIGSSIASGTRAIGSLVTSDIMKTMDYHRMMTEFPTNTVGATEDGSLDPKSMIHECAAMFYAMHKFYAHANKLDPSKSFKVADYATFMTAVTKSINRYVESKDDHIWFIVPLEPDTTMQGGWGWGKKAAPENEGTVTPDSPPAATASPPEKKGFLGMFGKKTPAPSSTETPAPSSTETPAPSSTETPAPSSGTEEQSTVSPPSSPKKKGLFGNMFTKQQKSDDHESDPAASASEPSTTKKDDKPETQWRFRDTMFYITASGESRGTFGNTWTHPFKINETDINKEAHRISIETLRGHLKNTMLTGQDASGAEGAVGESAAEVAEVAEAVKAAASGPGPNAATPGTGDTPSEEAHAGGGTGDDDDQEGGGLFSGLEYKDVLTGLIGDQVKPALEDANKRSKSDRDGVPRIGEVAAMFYLLHMWCWRASESRDVYIKIMHDLQSTVFKATGVRLAVPSSTGAAFDDFVAAAESGADKTTAKVSPFIISPGVLNMNTLVYSGDEVRKIAFGIFGITEDVRPTANAQASPP